MRFSFHPGCETGWENERQTFSEFDFSSARREADTGERRTALRDPHATLTHPWTAAPAQGSDLTFDQVSRLLCDAAHCVHCLIVLVCRWTPIMTV